MINGFDEIILYARVLYFINNINIDIFHNDFQMPQLSAPKVLSQKHDYDQ